MIKRVFRPHFLKIYIAPVSVPELESFCYLTESIIYMLTYLYSLAVNFKLNVYQGTYV